MSKRFAIRMKRTPSTVLLLWRLTIVTEINEFLKEQDSSVNPAHR